MGAGFIEVALKPKSESRFFQDFRSRVKNLFFVAGKYDLFVEVNIQDMAELLDFLHEVQHQEYVIRSRVSLVLKVLKDEERTLQDLSEEEKDGMFNESIHAFIGIHSKDGGAAATVKDLPDIKRLFTIRGHHEMLAYLMCANMSDVLHNLMEIRTKHAVSDTHTYFILRAERAPQFV